MHRIAISVFNPIVVLFSSILRWRVLASRRKLPIILGFLFFVPLVKIALADETGVPEQYGHPGDWRDHDWSDSDSSAPSSSGSSSSGKSSYQRHFEDRSAAAHRSGNLEAELQINRERLQHHPGDAGSQCEVFISQARIAAQKGDWKSADYYFAQASRVYPNYSNLRLYRGHFAVRKGDWNTAIRDFQEVLRQTDANSFPVAYNNVRGFLVDAQRHAALASKVSADKPNGGHAKKNYGIDLAATPSPKAVSDHSTGSSNKKSSGKSTLPLEAFSQSQRQTTGSAAQREANGSNTNAGDQLVKAKSHGDTLRSKSSSEAAAEEATKGFDQGGGSTKGHLNAVNMTGASSGHPEISAVPDKYKKNPTKYAEIMGYDHEARESASKVQKLKQDLAKLEEKTPSDSNERGKNEVEKVKVRTDLKIAESHRNAAELNKRDKMRQFAKEEGL